MSQLPPPPDPSHLPPPPELSHLPPPPSWPGPPAPGLDATQRFELARTRRFVTDYVFDFWTAFGWMLLTCGVYGLYVFYRLMERDREHNRRRLELLDAANERLWARAESAGRGEELRPHFALTAVHLGTLHQLNTQFRDPVAWLLLAIVVNFAAIVGYIFIDSDLTKHEAAEEAIESEFAAIAAALGARYEPQMAAAPKTDQNYVGRILAAVFTCGVYSFWWIYDLMTDGNENQARNQANEDALAAALA